jgi:hypothetical protein
MVQFHINIVLFGSLYTSMLPDKNNCGYQARFGDVILAKIKYNCPAN